jgi:hypothetical protein
VETKPDLIDTVMIVPDEMCSMFGPSSDCSRLWTWRPWRRTRR